MEPALALRLRRTLEAKKRHDYLDSASCRDRVKVDPSAAGFGAAKSDDIRRVSFEYGEDACSLVFADNRPQLSQSEQQPEIIGAAVGNHASGHIVLVRCFLLLSRFGGGESEVRVVDENSQR